MQFKDFGRPIVAVSTYTPVLQKLKDLGVDSAGANRRRVTTSLKLFTIDRARNLRLHRSKIGLQAKRLYTTSIFAAEVYGREPQESQGIAPQKGRHVGRSKWGSVDLTLDCMSHKCQDPLLTVVLVQADTLFRMFGPSTRQGWSIL